MDKFNPFKFEGRIGRLQYFGFGVIWGMVLTVIAMMVGAMADPYGEVSVGGAFIVVILGFVYIVATLSYGVRRLHDFDKTGWWYLLSFVPGANLVMGLVLLLAPGTPGANTYGTR